MTDALPSLQDVIAHFGLRAKKNFGQHFLLDQTVTDRIVQKAGVSANMDVIEIGPGPGGLTRALLASPAKRITVVEKDERCLPVMQQLRDVAEGRLNILMGDALEVNLAEHTDAPRAIIANLPYNVGTQMVLQWLQQWYDDAEAFAHVTVMLQQEVVERLMAQPKSKSYGRLSVLCQWLCHASQLMHLPPEAFTPPPKVDSGVVQLSLRKRDDKVPFALMEKLLQTAFNQRRKMLRKALQPLGVDVLALCAAAGIAETKRPDEISVADYVRLAEAYAAL